MEKIKIVEVQLPKFMELLIKEDKIKNYIKEAIIKNNNIHIDNDDLKIENINNEIKNYVQLWIAGIRDPFTGLSGTDYLDLAKQGIIDIDIKNEYMILKDNEDIEYYTLPKNIIYKVLSTDDIDCNLKIYKTQRIYNMNKNKETMFIRLEDYKEGATEFTILANNLSEEDRELISVILKPYVKFYPKENSERLREIIDNMKSKTKDKKCHQLLNFIESNVPDNIITLSNIGIRLPKLDICDSSYERYNKLMKESKLLLNIKEKTIIIDHINEDLYNYLCRWILKNIPFNPDYISMFIRDYDNKKIYTVIPDKDIIGILKILEVNDLNKAPN